MNSSKYASARSRAGLTAFAWLAVLMITGVPARADRVEVALATPARSAADRQRDQADHTAELLRLAGIAPGMRVLDMLGGDGYFSEAVADLVGPGGHVVLLNNAAFDHWSEPALTQRLAGGRLPTVEHMTADLNALGLADASFDVIILSKVYHDLYWVDPSGEWPRLDTDALLRKLVAVLKPGGVLLMIDHAAAAGHGSRDASSLHRIEESYARADFEHRGLRVIATSRLLHRADDAHDQVSYKPPLLGKTDRFVLVLRKARQP